MHMLKRLPYFVILQGKKYKINVDFRKMISFEKKVQDKRMDKSKIIEFGIRNFYPAFSNMANYYILLTQPELYKEACQKIIWFYKCGRENYHKQSGKGNSGKKAQIYSYDYDDEYIYGAFLEQYGIDLTSEKVHWWKFKALLNSLKEDTEFVKIKSYRAYTGEDEKMLELKEFWELPVPIEEQERLNKIYDTLK